MTEEEKSQDTLEEEIVWFENEIIMLESMKINEKRLKNLKKLLND
jgi:hypothetical protein